MGKLAVKYLMKPWKKKIPIKYLSLTKKPCYMKKTTCQVFNICILTQWQCLGFVLKVGINLLQSSKKIFKIATKYWKSIEIIR